MDSLSIRASNLSVIDPPMATSLNASNYPVSGICESTQGNVTVTIGTPNVSESVSCSGGSYSATLDVTLVTANPMIITVAQSTNEVIPSGAPENDQTGPSTAPVATAPSGAVGGSGVQSYGLVIDCNEQNEEVTISGGQGLDPATQTYTCASDQSETWSLNLASNIETPDPNNFTLSSEDEHGNTAGSTTTVNIPIDTQGPIVSITNGGDIIAGVTASFTITVTDANFGNASYTPTINQNSATLNPTACTTNPCLLTVSGATSGSLILTVAANSVTDSVSNTGPSSLVSSTLSVGASSLDVDSLGMATSANAATYMVSGNCENSQGSVTVTAGTPNVSESANCSGGKYTVTLNVSGVNSNPMTVSISQGTNTIAPGVHPANDQNGPVSAPTATAPSGAVGGASYSLAIDCNEAHEEVSITGGQGLNPATQTYTCASNQSETWSLNLASNIETPDPNNFTLSSEDEHGNTAGSTTTVNVPIDTQGPRVVVTHGGNITEGSNATFTITVTDANFGNASYTPTINQNSATLNPTACTTNPCLLTVSGATSGSLILTVAANSVTDSVSNTGPSSLVSSTLSVGASSLDVDSLGMATSANAATYMVSGNCENSQGSVTVTAGTPNVSESANCSGGKYTVTLNVSGVNSNPMTVSISQGTNTIAPGVYPANDQNGPVSAPTATAPSGAVGGASYSLAIDCNEAHEEVSITGGQGLAPTTQTFTCASGGVKTWNLTLESDVETTSSNILTLSSEDEHGNPAGSTTTVNIPIDTKAPVVSITNGGDIVAGATALFTIIVTDANFGNVSYTPTINQTSTTLNPTVCTTSPCLLIVSGATSGTLMLTVAANSVTDSVLNTGPSSLVSNTLNVEASSLDVDSLAMVTSANAATYMVSGNCEATQGDVTVTAGTSPSTSASSVCSGERYTVTLNVSGVNSNTMTVSISQGTNTFNSSATVVQEGTEDCFEISNNALSDYYCLSQVVTIPTGVTSIEDGAFEGKGLTSVTLPQTLTHIKANAFKDNDLMDITIPATVTDIGDNAFAGNSSLGQVYIIPNSSVSVGTGAFPNGHVVATASFCFSFASGNPNQIDDYYDNEGNNSNNSACPRDVVIPQGVTALWEYAFASNALTSVVIPDSVTSIERSAFYDNALTSVTIPDSVTSIKDHAFSTNDLTSVTISDGVESIGLSAFFDNDLALIIIPDSVTTIGGGAFHTNALTSITIPDSVTSIGNGAFNNNSLTSVIIGSGITSIGAHAFNVNPNLASVCIEASSADVTVGTNAFPTSVTPTYDDDCTNNND